MAIRWNELLGSDLNSPRSVLAKRVPYLTVLLHVVLASGGHREQSADDDRVYHAGPITLIDRGPTFEEVDMRWRATRA